MMNIYVSKNLNGVLAEIYSIALESERPDICEKIRRFSHEAGNATYDALTQLLSELGCEDMAEVLIPMPDSCGENSETTDVYINTKEKVRARRVSSRNNKRRSDALFTAISPKPKDSPKHESDIKYAKLYHSNNIGKKMRYLSKDRPYPTKIWRHKRDAILRNENKFEIKVADQEMAEEAAYHEELEQHYLSA